MSMSYYWKDGSRLHGDADTVGRELEALHEEHGTISAELVLEAATPKKSTLHDYFEWDNSAAAHEYRLEQARLLVRSIVVKIERDDSAPVTTRAFVQINQPLKDDTPQVSGTYMPLSVVVQDTDLRHQLVKQALHEIEVFQRKYAALEEVIGYVVQLREALEVIA